MRVVRGSGISAPDGSAERRAATVRRVWRRGENQAVSDSTEERLVEAMRFLRMAEADGFNDEHSRKTREAVRAAVEAFADTVCDEWHNGFEAAAIQGGHSIEGKNREHDHAACRSRLLRRVMEGDDARQ